MSDELGLGVNFVVQIDGQDLGMWTKCEGLGVTYDVFEYKEGGNNAFVHRLPGRAKYDPVKLTRVVNSSTTAVMTWLTSVQATPRYATAKISVHDAAGEEVASWNLTGVYPSRWTGPSLDANGKNVATETLELVHNGFLGS
jgi:phage tail-like protein